MTLRACPHFGSDSQNSALRLLYWFPVKWVSSLKPWDQFHVSRVAYEENTGRQALLVGVLEAIRCGQIYWQEDELNMRSGMRTQSILRRSLAYSSGV